MTQNADTIRKKVIILTSHMWPEPLCTKYTYIPDKLKKKSAIYIINISLTYSIFYQKEKRKKDSKLLEKWAKHMDSSQQDKCTWSLSISKNIALLLIKGT